MADVSQNDLLKQNVADSLLKILDYHGYGFHYKVLRFAKDLFERRSTTWTFQAAELPVEVGGTSTKIDFVMRRGTSQHYLVAECKRANPALSTWCFVRAPYVRRNRSQGEILVEEVRVNQEKQITAGGTAFSYGTDLYHIGLEVKSGNKGDPVGSGRGAIEEAATQVCRGLNGMVEFLAMHPQVLGNNQVARIIPVIFTTAQIWTSDLDLGEADLETGKFNLASIDVVQKPWIWYRYHQSPGIKHKVPAHEARQEIGDILDLRYARTIAVVSATGVEDFLTREWWDL